MEYDHVKNQDGFMNDIPCDLILNVLTMAEGLTAPFLVSKELFTKITQEPRKGANIVMNIAGGSAIKAMNRFAKCNGLTQQALEIATIVMDLIAEDSKAIKEVLLLAVTHDNHKIVNLILQRMRLSELDRSILLSRALSAAISENSIDVVEEILGYGKSIINTSHITNVIESGCVELVKTFDRYVHDKVICAAVKLYNIDLAADLVRGPEDGQIIASILLNAISKYSDEYLLINDIIMFNWSRFDIKSETIKLAESNRSTCANALMLRAMWSIW